MPMYTKVRPVPGQQPVIRGRDGAVQIPRKPLVGGGSGIVPNRAERRAAARRKGGKR